MTTNGDAAAMAKSASLRAAVKEEPPDDGPPSFATPEDAVAAFKQMLYDKGVSSTAKWGDVQKSLSKERCWAALKTGEKKQAFAEYQTKRMKEEKEEKRARVSTGPLRVCLSYRDFCGVERRFTWTFVL